jgi:hypothetical protein
MSSGASTREKRLVSGLDVQPAAKVMLVIPAIFRKVLRFIPKYAP